MQYYTKQTGVQCTDSISYFILVVSYSISMYRDWEDSAIVAAVELYQQGPAPTLYFRFLEMVPNRYSYVLALSSFFCYLLFAFLSALLSGWVGANLPT